MQHGVSLQEPESELCQPRMETTLPLGSAHPPPTTRVPDEPEMSQPGSKDFSLQLGWWAEDLGIFIFSSLFFTDP